MNSHLAVSKKPQNPLVLPFPPGSRELFNPLAPCFCHRTNLPLWKSIVHQNILIQAKAKARPCPASCGTRALEGLNPIPTNHRPGWDVFETRPVNNWSIYRPQLTGAGFLPSTVLICWIPIRWVGNQPISSTPKRSL